MEEIDMPRKKIDNKLKSYTKAFSLRWNTLQRLDKFFDEYKISDGGKSAAIDNLLNEALHQRGVNI